jgi:anti-sigma B factor antagonist
MVDNVNMEIIPQGDIAIVVFNATSMSSVEAISVALEQIYQFISQNHPKEIVVDFSRVKFFSSQVLGMLLGVRAKLGVYNGEIVISGINPQLYRVFKITNLDKIFKFFPDRESAIKSLDTK